MRLNELLVAVHGLLQERVAARGGGDESEGGSAWGSEAPLVLSHGAAVHEERVYETLRRVAQLLERELDGPLSSRPTTSSPTPFHT